MNSDFSRRMTILAFGLLCCGFAAHFCSASDVQMRTWKDASGKYKIDARFVDVESSNVRLQKSDEINILVPFELLSSTDQNYIRSRLRQRQAERRRKPLPIADLRERRIDSPHPDAKTLSGINWYPAESVSNVAGGKQEKPVMWFRVLGSLDGFM